MQKLAFFLIVIFCLSCKNKLDYHLIQGSTMGTYYKVTFAGNNLGQLKNEIDQLLIDINNSLSTYIETATISKINKSDSTFCFNKSDDKFFVPVFNKAKEIYTLTDGVFDPTIAPIINYWGFGYTGHEAVTNVDSVKINHLLRLIGFDKLYLEENNNNICISKPNDEISIDFSALAKGYGIDVIADLLDQKGIENYLIDIGGESRAKGLNSKHKIWSLGISKPSLDAELNEVIQLINLDNKAIATSGNYRNYRKYKESFYSHIINPKKGYFERSNTLSVSVITNDCMTADALATSFMILSREKSKQIAASLNDVEVFFIYLDENNEMSFDFSNGFQKYLLQN